jgi:YggT family protein
MAFVVITVLELFTIVLIIRAILTWFPIRPDSPFRSVADALYTITEPVLGPIRRALPPMGGLDLSVLLVILAINLLLIPLAARTLP